jgi:predicted metal-dependent hydrolase
MSQLELFSIESTAIQPEGQGSQPAFDLSLCRIRESKRAKHVSIKISVQGEVEVVVPSNFDRARLPELLEKRRGWIEKTRSQLNTTAKDTSEQWAVEKPDTIVLRWRSTRLGDLRQSKVSAHDSAGKGFGQAFIKSPDKDLETWTVTYQAGEENQTLCIPGLDGRLIVRGNVEPAAACQAVLRKWLAHRAHRELTPWLRQLGYDLNLPCRRISVRGQKTRWASCSDEKDISLNYKLLFLPKPLVHYVLVHELCHTVHMNHSAAFWGLVGEKLPSYKQWDAELKTGWRYVPRWVEKSRD